MPRGDKSKYTDKQKRQAEHIEEGYKDSGLDQDEAEHRAWATVNKTSGGGKKPGGSGRGKSENKASVRKGGQERRTTSGQRSGAKQSASAQKAARTRGSKSVRS